MVSMNCTGCGYPLWNIRDRVCPECGLGFLPSNFDFVANSVRFHCPHCDQDYYGTDARGHLVPPTFACVKCSSRITMDETIVRTRHGIEEKRTRVDVLPWTDPHTRGIFRRFYKTTAMAIARPVELMRVTKGTPAAPAWWLYLLMMTVTYAIWLLPALLLFIPVLAGGGGARAGLSLALGLTISGGVMVLLGIAWPASSHVLLRLTGARGEGFSNTLGAIAYASPVNVFSWIPCVGMYVFFVTHIWHIVISIRMFMRAHAVGAIRATFAIATPPIVVLTAVIAAYIGLIVWSFAFSRTAMATAVAARSTAADVAVVARVTGALVTQAEGWPGHGIELLSPTGSLTPPDFIAGGTPALADQVSVARHSLSQLFVLGGEERAVLDAVAADDLDPGWTAHRVGDLVFTYHHVPRGSDLWVVILWPDARHKPGGPTAVLVGLADGTTSMYGIDVFAGVLDEQNTRRAELGLDPIPDPATVR